MATQYQDVAFGDLIVDNACLQLVLDPLKLDVLLLENLYGDIVSDLGCRIGGRVSALFPELISVIITRLFESVHGSAPDIKGKNIANPTAMILAAVMMLNHIGEKAAKRISNALETVLMKRRPFDTRSRRLGDDNEIRRCDHPRDRALSLLLTERLAASVDVSFIPPQLIALGRGALLRDFRDRRADAVCVIRRPSP